MRIILALSLSVALSATAAAQNIGDRLVTVESTPLKTGDEVRDFPKGGIVTVREAATDKLGATQSCQADNRPETPSGPVRVAGKSKLSDLSPCDHGWSQASSRRFARLGKK
jgi:hypothetical protein